MLLLSTSIFAQIIISPICIGLPANTKEATHLVVKVMPFETTAKTCSIYWQLNDISNSKLLEGDFILTEVQFTTWGADNQYIEDLVLTKLGLTRKIE